MRSSLMRRMPVMAVVALFAALVLGTVLSACAAPGSASATGPTGYWDAIDLGVPGELIGTVEGVEGYPGCRRETLTHDGVTWYPFTPENAADFPEVMALPARPGGFGGGLMVAPGPGDDVGTLTIYQGGFAFWRSESGELETWLTDQELEYPWIC